MRASADIALGRARAGGHEPAVGALDAALRWLAPFIAVAAVAYPSMIWSLTDAEIVDAGPMIAPPPPVGPPSMLLRVYFPLLAMFAIAALVAKFRRTPSGATTGIFNPAMLFCGLYLAFAALSHRWAVDPDLSLRRCILAGLIVVAIAGAILATDDWRRFANVLFWWFSLVVLLNTYAVLTQPPTALGHAGIYPHKNYFGAVSAMVFLASVHQLFIGSRSARIAAFCMIVATAVFLIAAKSKTSLALAILSPALAFSLAWLAHAFRISPALTLPLLCGSIYYVYAFGVISGFWDFEAMATAIFGDPTLTQRTEIWAFAFHMMPDHMVWGYGYEGFWGVGPESPSVRAGGYGFVAQMPHAHNGYIDLVLQTGYVGLAINACFILAALHAVGRVARTSLALGSFTLSYIVFVLLYNFFETTFFRSFNVKHMMLMVAISLAVAHNARMSNALAQSTRRLMRP